MEVSRKSYYRSYIILNEEMKGYASQERKPSGYCKVEVRGGKGKAQIHVQGLKQLPHGDMYKVFFIICRTGKSIGVSGALIEVDTHGKGEAKWEFDPDHVGSSPYKVEDFDVVAILVKQQSVPDQALLCPLVGYKDKECSWKNGYEEFQKQEMDATAIEEKADAKTAQVSEPTPQKEERIEKVQKEETVQKLEENEVEKQDAKKQVIEKEQLMEEQQTEYEQPIEEECISQDLYESTKQYEDWYGQSYSEQQEEVDENQEYEKYKKEMNFDFEDEEWGQWGYPEPFDTIQEEPGDPEEQVMMEEMFNSYPPMNPFENPMEDWEWIRISVRDLTALPVSTWRMMNNPFILTAYKRYNHLLLGRRENKLILGIPNIYHPREKNIAYIHGFSTFMCCQNVKPRTGEYGYWIIEME